MNLEQLQKSLSKGPIEQVHHPLLEQRQLQIWMKRDDRLHPVISGNKWRKLKYNLKQALDLGYGHIVSMGGPWSNHLHALAWAGRQLDIQTTGIIRGEECAIQTPTVKDLRQWRMKLHFVNREQFRQLRQYKNHDDKPGQQYNGYWLPEGGANRLALRGAAETCSEIDFDFDTICLACGTGTTLAGIAQSLGDGQKVLGFSALKGGHFLNREVSDLLMLEDKSSRKNWEVNFDYDFGGFAKTNQQLLTFIHEFEDQTGIPLEPVYTGKMMYGLFDLIEKKQFTPGQKIIALHTGGLQGNRGFGTQENAYRDQIQTRLKKLSHAYSGLGDKILV